MRKAGQHRCKTRDYRGKTDLFFDLPPRVIELFEELVTAHVIRNVVNERIEQLTAELKQRCPPHSVVPTDESNEDREKRLLQAASMILDGNL